MDGTAKSARRGSLLALGSIWLVALFLYILTHCISPLLPDLIIDFRLSHSMGGFLYSLPILMIGLLSYPFGIFSDRIGMERSICYGATIAVVFSLLRAFSPGFNLVALSTAMFGLGFALCLPNLPKFVKERFPPQFAGTATGAYTTAVPLAGGLAMSLTRPILEATGTWRTAVMVWSLAAIPAIVLWWIVSRRVGGRMFPVGPVDKDGTTRRTSAAVINPPASSDHFVFRLVVCGVLLALLNFIFYCTIGWLPTYLAESRWSPASGATATSVISFIEIPSMLLIPFLADRTGHRRLIIILSFLAMAICSAVVAVSPSLAWFTIPGFGITMGGPFSLLLAMPIELVERERVGRVAGAIISIGYIGALLGPPAAGYLRDVTGNFALSFFVTALVGLAAAVLSLCLPKPVAGSRTKRTG